MSPPVLRSGSACLDGAETPRAPLHCRVDACAERQGDEMADHREVRHERLYVKQPGTERLRKNAAGRLKHMLSTGWRETERWHAEDYITVRMERTGVSPSIGKPPRAVPAEPRPPRDMNRRGQGGPQRRGR